MLVGWTFGLMTLAAGLWRARIIPAWGAACLGTAPLVPAVAGGRVGVAIGFLVLLTGFASAARALTPAAAQDRVVTPQWH